MGYQIRTEVLNRKEVLHQSTELQLQCLIHIVRYAIIYTQLPKDSSETYLQGRSITTKNQRSVKAFNQLQERGIIYEFPNDQSMNHFYS